MQIMRNEDGSPGLMTQLLDIALSVFINQDLEDYEKRSSTLSTSKSFPEKTQDKFKKRIPTSNAKKTTQWASDYIRLLPGHFFMCQNPETG